MESASRNTSCSGWHCRNLCQNSLKLACSRSVSGRSKPQSTCQQLRWMTKSIQSLKRRVGKTVPARVAIGTGRLSFSCFAIKRCESLSVCRSLQEARAERPPLELAATSPMSETTSRATRTAAAQVLAWANRAFQSKKAFWSFGLRRGLGANQKSFRV